MPRVYQAFPKHTIEDTSEAELPAQRGDRPFHRSLRFFCLGVLLGIAFHFSNTSYSVFLAWAFCLGLATSIHSVSPRVFDFLLVGIGIQLTVYHWLPGSIVTYGGFGTSVSLLLWLLFVFVSALPTVFAGFLYRHFQKSGVISQNLSLGFAWMTGELFIPSLIPWKLAHTQLPFPLFSNSADIFGASLLSGLMLYWSSVFVGNLIRWERPSLPFFASIFAILSYSLYRHHVVATEIHSTLPLTLGIVQPNLSPRRDFKPENLEVVLKKEQALSEPLLREDEIDLLIWPESSVWIGYPERLSRIRRGSSVDPFPGLKVPLLFGGQTAVRTPPAHLPQLKNSVYLLEPDGRLSGVYSKQVLFPFTEKIPLQETFPSLRRLNGKNYEVVAGGRTQSPISFFRRFGSKEVVRVGTAICYEDLWSEPFRRQVINGAVQILVSFSNDAWFERSKAVQEHYLVAAWRAVELRRYLIRSTMDGVTAVLDPFGKEVEKIESFVEGALKSSEVRPLNSISLYAAVGDIPLMSLCGIITLLCTLKRMPQRGGRAGKSKDLPITPSSV